MLFRSGRATTALGTVDYDVTNYFFHIDQDDADPEGKTGPRGTASRQRGHSKENRPDPIIQLGLFLDAEGIPVSYRLFDGNVPDTSTLPAVLGEFKTAFRCERIVVVADKAMNTKNNLGALAQNGDGWIVSASARGADKTMKTWLLDPKGWTGDEHGRTKSMIITRSVPVTMYGVENVPFNWNNEILPSAEHTLPNGEFFAEKFHVFEIEWDEQSIVWKLDGTKIGERSISEATRSEFHENFYVIFNIAVGGNFTATPDSSTPFPQYMYIDWIRHYTKQ